jgi:hypothetical protein
VKLVGVGELHAAFLNESRTRGRIQRSVQEIRGIVKGNQAAYDRGSTEMEVKYVEVHCLSVMLPSRGDDSM